MRKKYYIIYRTINLINEKIYIGVHGTNNLIDNYIGSGKLLKRAIKKYGRKWFKRKILFIFDDIEEAYEKEREIVNEALIMRSDVYNIHGGGMGGRVISEETRKKQSLAKLGNKLTVETRKKQSLAKIGKKKSEKTRELMRKPKSPTHRKNMSMSQKGIKNPNKKWTPSQRKKIIDKISGENAYWFGKSHSNETKQKISNKLKGENGSNYGKHLSDETKQKLSESKKGRKFINKDGANKVVKIEDLDIFLKSGWKVGKI